MISFVNFAKIASICVDFDLGTLHGYFFHQDFWPNLNFSLQYQIKLVLIFWATRCKKPLKQPNLKFLIVVLFSKFSISV